MSNVTRRLTGKLNHDTEKQDLVQDRQDRVVQPCSLLLLLLSSHSEKPACFDALVLPLQSQTLHPIVCSTMAPDTGS